MKRYIVHATDSVCIQRSLKTSLLVGTILTIINQVDAIVLGHFTIINVYQTILNYFVPYFVSTFGSVMEMERCSKVCNDLKMKFAEKLKKK